MTTYHVTGTAHLVDGFDITVEADCEIEARAKAHRRISDRVYPGEVSLNEICIECVQHAAPTTTLPPSTGNELADLVMLARKLTGLSLAEKPTPPCLLRELGSLAYSPAAAAALEEADRASEVALEPVPVGFVDDKLDAGKLVSGLQAVGLRVIVFE